MRRVFSGVATWLRGGPAFHGAKESESSRLVDGGLREPARVELNGATLAYVPYGEAFEAEGWAASGTALGAKAFLARLGLDGDHASADRIVLGGMVELQAGDTANLHAVVRALRSAFAGPIVFVADPAQQQGFSRVAAATAAAQDALAEWGIPVVDPFELSVSRPDADALLLVNVRRALAVLVCE